MSKAFEPIQIGPMEIKNRIMHSATCEAMATQEGQITDALLRRYTTLSKGEVGLIAPGHMFVHPRGQAHQGQIGIHTDEMIPGLKKLAGAIQDQGGKVAFQLAHAGRQAPKSVTGSPPLAPSRHGMDPVSLNLPRKMSVADIQETIQDFVHAAQRAVEADADAVQLHCAHGYLMSQFLSPFFNRRRDDYGGSTENRFRFIQEVFLGVRSVLPEHMPILVKLNTHDGLGNKGITPALAADYVRRLVELGAAAVEVSGGTYYNFHTIRGEIPGAEIAAGLPLWMRPAARVKMKFQVADNRFREAFNLEAAKVVRPALNGSKLILVGGMRRLAHMEEVLSQGAADVVSLSRPLIREPLLVKQFREGKTREASCVSCNKCFAAIFCGKPVRCYYKA